MTTAVALLRTTLRDVPDDAWDVPAGTLTWTCWETIEHTADDLFAYALQIAPSDPPQDTHMPAGWKYLREGGPALTIFVERDSGTLGLLRVLEGCGAMLAGVVAAAPADRLSHHGYGISDPEGFAAMGVVETLVHGFDVAGTLGVTFQPPADLCQRVIDRLFPDLPEHPDPWERLLWATGRGMLPGHPKRDSWRWDGRPAAMRLSVG
ncbi:mycothiol maleylpyruvate isomerase-like protein [Asanoa ferruginea]|uniref:Mycothiol maleylpyruvate isomerase-like protein n=1 Tax=Asanoa ferruginea TaxID=53367 RepID=A0A3D9ZWP0_9ACTN|nr:mycothiol maleylpyruvate isomerase-like protein [Asanoa ferruginea]